MAQLTDQQSHEIFAMNSVAWKGESGDYERLVKLAEKLLGQGKSWESVKAQIRGGLKK